MMYTTVRATKNPVKFWVPEAVPSPQFKRFLPVMAAKYGFQFELVTYKFGFRRCPFLLFACV